MPKLNATRYDDQMQSNSNPDAPFQTHAPASVYLEHLYLVQKSKQIRV